jgi:uncharacterized protein YcfL
MIRMKPIAMAILAGGLLAGCQHQTVDTVKVGPQPEENYKWIKTDYGVDDVAKVVSARKDRVNGLLRVQVQIVSRSRETQTLTYKWEWLDADGMEIISITTTEWLPLVLGGKEDKLISAIGPDPRIVDARLKLQKSVR